MNSILTIEAIRRQFADLSDAQRYRTSRLVDQFGRPIYVPQGKIGDTITVKRPRRIKA